MTDSDREMKILAAGWSAMFDTPWDASQAAMMGAGWDAMRAASIGPRGASLVERLNREAEFWEAQPSGDDIAALLREAMAALQPPSHTTE